MKQLPQIKMKGTLADRTYETLKHAIINLELLPGEIITEESISEQLGVSRTPIRSAMNLLCQEGLVTIAQGKGSFVTELSEQEVKNLFDVRIALEQLAIRLAMEKIEDRDTAAALFQPIRTLVEEQVDTFTGEGRDSRRFMLSDIAFHMAISQVSGNPYLSRQLESILNNCSRYSIAFLGKLLDHSAEVHSAHREVIDRMERCEAEAAETVLLEHVNVIREKILKSLRERQKEQSGRKSKFSSLL